MKRDFLTMNNSKHLIAVKKSALNSSMDLTISAVIKTLSPDLL
jgi:hypothetical protein